MALGRSEVRRLRVFDLEQVRHFQNDQEWVPHWHEEWSFGAVLAGECRCSVGGRPFLARTGDLMAIPPGVVHTGALAASSGGGGVSVVMLYVPTQWLLNFAAAVPRRSVKASLPGLAQAAAHLDSTEAVQAWLQRATRALAQAAMRQAGEQPTDPRPSDAVRTVIVQVQEALQAGETSVAGIARRCSISRERLHRILTRWIGMSPAEYFRAIRVLRSRQLLLDGTPIARVAAECGFADQAHFTRWFRRAFGYTPGDFVRATHNPVVSEDLERRA